MSEANGIIFVEALIKDDKINDADIDRISYEKLQAELEHQLSSENLTFELLEDIIDDEHMTVRTDGQHKLGPLYQHAKDILESLKVVEYMGPIRNLACYSTEDVRVEVQIYSLCNTPYSTAGKQLPQAEVLSLPHSRLANQWEELVFEDNIKVDLIWMMTNILKFSRLCDQGEINPLILLYGPPGCGKTTLCRGLAQKASIRLNTIYTHAILIQIKTPTMLSRYYSESARQVDDIFNKITQICQENPEDFVCVLMDEVESIASSREFSTKSGEPLDSMRATNALLTGLDRAKVNTNVIFLFTSNMYEALDSAFLDRCGLKRSVNPPSIISQYEILRNRIQKLIKRGIIELTHPEGGIPNYDEAVLISTAGHTGHPGCKLLEIVCMIRSSNPFTKFGKGISGRFLTQLPEQAILRYARSDKCDLGMVLVYITKFIISEQEQNKTAMELEKTNPKYSKERKRKFKLTIEDVCDSQAIEKYKTIICSQALSTNFKFQVEEDDI